MLAASPVLLLNTIQFHSPFRTGYDFWTPFFSKNHLFFSLRYVPNNASALWNEFALQPLDYHTANIFGTGTCFVPAFVFLTCAGLFFIRIDRFVTCAVLACSAFLGVILTHNYRLVDARYYLPLLILSIALFAAACLGVPSRSGYKTQSIGRCQAWDALHFTTPPHESVQFIAQKEFAKRLGRQPGIVLSDIDPVYLNALLVAAPVDGQHNYKWSYAWHYDQAQASALVEHGLQQSLPVYALFTSPNDLTTNQSRLPTIPGYEWRILNNSDGNAAILKLTALGQGQPTPPE